MENIFLFTLCFIIMTSPSELKFPLIATNAVDFAADLMCLCSLKFPHCDALILLRPYF